MSFLRSLVRGRRAPVPSSQQTRRIILAVGLALSAWLVFFPAKQLAAQKMKIAGLQTRLNDIRDDNRTLAAEVQRLEDPDELEVLARDRLGWVKPGERAYLVVAQPTPPPPPPEAREPWWSRVADRVVKFVRGNG